MKKQAFVLTLGVVLVAVAMSMGMLFGAKAHGASAGGGAGGQRQGGKFRPVTIVSPGPTRTRTWPSSWFMERI